MANSPRPFGGLGEASTSETRSTPRKSRKVADLPLYDLYARVREVGKVTPSIRSAIIAKEDFNTVQKTYCDLTCGLSSSSRRPAQVRLQQLRTDIVIIQDHNALPDKFKTSEQQEKIYRDIIGYLATKHFQGLSFTVLNTLKCLPQASDLRGANITITKLKPCSAYLHSELRRIEPKAIIVLSTNSVKVLGLNLSSSGNRGEFHQTEFGPAVITLHPKVLTMIRQNASGKDWGPDYLEVLDRDFEKAARIARGDLKIVDLDTALLKASEFIRIARSLDDVKAMTAELSALPEGKIISFDLETTGLDAWAEDAKILTAQFGFTDSYTGDIRAFVIPLWHRENKGFSADEAWPYIAEILLSTRPKVGHNIKFDIIYTYVTTGVRVENAAFDTMLLMHAINSGLKNNYSLKKGVWDFMPETGLGGYEDKLPALTKTKRDEDGEAEDE